VPSWIWSQAIPGALLILAAWLLIVGRRRGSHDHEVRATAVSYPALALVGVFAPVIPRTYVLWHCTGCKSPASSSSLEGRWTLAQLNQEDEPEENTQEAPLALVVDRPERADPDVR